MGDISNFGTASEQVAIQIHFALTEAIYVAWNKAQIKAASLLSKVIEAFALHFCSSLDSSRPLN